MKIKHTLAAISLIVLFAGSGVSTASALVDYPQGWYSGPCVNLSRDAAYGARGAEVTRLQKFLAAQGFPGGGDWMVTGFFGGATQSAVRIFQQAQGLPTTGVADTATRAAISRLSCGGLVSYVPPSTQYPTTIPWNGYTSVPYQGLVSLNLTSLSQNTGAPGSQVTIYGTGFDAVNNTINFGTVVLSGVPSNGTSMTFIVPSSTAYGTVNISVTDSRGTSNSLSFTMYSYGYGYGCSNGYYPYGGYNTASCGCGSSYPYALYGSAYFSGSCGTVSTVNQVTAPVASYLNPSSGSTGTSVTVIGNGFTSTNNSVHFGTGVIANLGSNDGQSVSFVVPNQLTGYGSQNTALGVYNVSVTNGSGYTTNALPFTVTGLSNSAGPVSITGVNGPSTLSAGAVGTWTVTLNNPTNSTVTVTPTWGDSVIYPYGGAIAPQSTYSQGTVTLTFNHAYSASGTYAVSFVVHSMNGDQTTAPQNVVVTNSTSNYGYPTITYLSPASGYVGAQVTIYGSNFASYDTILFGSGAIQNVYSNGSSITFTVPSYLSPYCASGYACPQYAQQVTAGTYNVSVQNSNGTSNTLSFLVY